MKNLKKCYFALTLSNAQNHFCSTPILWLDSAPLHTFHHLWQAESMCCTTGSNSLQLLVRLALIIDITLVFSFAKFKAKTSF